MWLPYIILGLPGLSTGDTLDELCQFFHRDTWSVNAINLIDENVYINKHHSVFHTVVLGLFFKIGRELSSFTVGAFSFVFLQVVLFVLIFSFMIKYMKKIGINSWLLLFSILFLGFNPTIVTFGLTAIKDTPSALFNLLYVIYLLQIVKDFDSVFKSKLRLFGLFLVILLSLVLRNNGIYTILLSFPFLFFVYKDRWKKILIVMLIPLMLFGVYDKILLPMCGVSDGSIREVLSIPVMQIARVSKYKPDVFSDRDKEIIDKVFDFELIDNMYDPDISDNVKNLYNKDASSNDLKNFLGVWFKYLRKEPIIYIESFINSTYGYFCPEKNRDMYYLYDFKFRKDNFFDVGAFEVFDDGRDVFNQIIDIYYKLPFFMNKVAYYDWLLIFSCCYVIKKKKYKYLVPLSALLAILLSCLASPLNGSFRYIMPIMFSVPIILSIDYLVYYDGGD